MSEAKGLFVSFEGIDGSGKSTQARLLAERLRALGREVVLTREPGGSPGAEEIRRLVLTGDRARWSPETEILLFTAARRDHLERTIRPALGRGAVVITDRFADSTRLYQGTTRGDLRALVDRLHDMMIGVEPDLTILIDMDPAKALRRSLKRLAQAEMAKAKAELQAVISELTGSYDQTATGGDKLSSSDAEKNQREPEGVAPSATPTKPEEASEDRFESFGLPFQVRLRQGFLSLAQSQTHRIVVVEGDRPEDEVAAEIARITTVHLETA